MSEISCGMGKYDEYEWTAEQVAWLAALAKRKGITKSALAEEWLGVFPTTLSYWMSTKEGSRREPTPMAKRLLSCIAPKIERMADRSGRGKSQREAPASDTSETGAG
jgi:hypothetical protein